ncbi:MAG TPA: hypothetical protein VLC07_09720 [Solirubrobacterales bacterium]|nr:hypothetical protein [Solirubrobacterales bacterium]
MAVAIVAGALANKPGSGGEAWVRLSWILGLRRLGFDVFFVERLAAGDEVGRRCFEAVAAEFGLEERSGLIDPEGEAYFGMSEATLAEVAAEAEVIFNISGHLGGGPILERPRHRAYIDLDPGFTQIWHADPELAFEVAGHDSYVTVGLNIGSEGNPIPAGGIGWIPTFPPVVLDEWPAAPAPQQQPTRFTTVATWRSPYGQVRIGDQLAGLKHHEFRRFLRLPEEVPEAIFELALDIHEGDAADREALLAHGWKLVSPREAAGSPQAFRSYLQASGAEFSVAQGVYVEGRTGWFSDRTAAYLASGRPALVQETGIERLPAGEGLLTFSNSEEAAAGARRLAEDPARQAMAAREIAERHLDSDLVLGALLERIGVEW